MLDPQAISPGTSMPSGLFRRENDHWVFAGPTPPSFQGYDKDHRQVTGGLHFPADAGGAAARGCVDGHAKAACCRTSDPGRLTGTHHSGERRFAVEFSGFVSARQTSRFSRSYARRAMTRLSKWSAETRFQQLSRKGDIMNKKTLERCFRHVGFSASGCWGCSKKEETTGQLPRRSSRRGASGHTH